jgi:hypothetical protein
MPSSTKKDPVQVMASLSIPPGKAQAKVTLDANSQASVLSFILDKKVDALLASRERFTDALRHNPPSPMTLTAAIQGIDAEVNLCLTIMNDLDNNTPIQFPSAAQISALSAAVGALGTATTQGAAVAALIPAVANVIATFPA